MCRGSFATKLIRLDAVEIIGRFRLSAGVGRRHSVTVRKVLLLTGPKAGVSTAAPDKKPLIVILCC